MRRIGIITAFLNEAENLAVFRQRLVAALEMLPIGSEIVLVDDHSSDSSTAIAKQWASEDSRVKYFRLSRTCGSHASFSAGLAECTGDCAVLLAADLQDPPETIPTLLEKWREGYDVVWAVRAGRATESWTTKFLAGIYYRLMRRLALPEMSATGADFLLLGRKVIDAYNAIPEKNTSFLAMILWMGFRQTSIEYVKQPRYSGGSKWTLAKKIKLFVDSIVSFSYVPIRLMSALGLGMAFAGLLYAVYIAIGRLVGWVTAGTGFAEIITILLIGQGTIITMLGVLGEYLWRTFDEARGRPRYIVEERFQSNGDVKRLPWSTSGDSEHAVTATTALPELGSARDHRPL